MKWNLLAFGLIQIHENAGKGQRIRMEGLELFHYFSGKRPPFLRWCLLKRLNGTVIAQGSDYLMTQNERGYQLVLDEL